MVLQIFDEGVGQVEKEACCLLVLDRFLPVDLLLLGVVDLVVLLRLVGILVAIEQAWAEVP